MTYINFNATSQDYLEAYPHPLPAKKCLPDWYKKMPQVNPDYPLADKVLKNSAWDVDENGEFTFLLTMKSCPPVLDLMTSGYIVPLWTTMYINRNEKDEKIYIAWPEQDKSHLGDHGIGQVRGCPFEKEFESAGVSKFMSPWQFETPKGYSTLFMPVYYEGQSFEILPAIVDTDKYHEVNFPFRYKGKDGRVKVDRGTPLVHAIPFKREEFTSNVGVVNARKVRASRRLLQTYGARFYHSIKSKKIFR